MQTICPFVFLFLWPPPPPPTNYIVTLIKPSSFVWYVIPLLKTGVLASTCDLFLWFWRWDVVHTNVGQNVTPHNPFLGLFLYHFLHTMSSWHHKSIHNNTNKQQTPPPWWWRYSPLQQCGFDESTPLEGRAALRIHFLRPLLKGLVKFNKFMYKLIYLYQSLCLIDVGLSAGNNGGQNGIHRCWRTPTT